MPIKKRLKQVAAAKSTSTHGGNEDKLNIEEGDVKALNHMSVDTLTDPEDYTSGDTHTSVTAKAKKVKAAEESTNVGTLDNDEDPAAGVLENASADGEDDEDDELGDDNDVDASFDAPDEDLENNNAATPLTAEDGAMEDDWDAPPPDAGLAADIDEADDVELDDEAGADFVAPPDPEDNVGGEELALLDVDETVDTDVGDVAFASFGTRLMVVKANRIIASMTARMAKASGREDVYLTDQFQEVTASELGKKGLRRGLKTMGFALAKVNVAKTNVVNARVQLEVTKTTAAVRKVAASKEAAFQQSLTIAAVGINRRYFNEQPNELKAHLEAELQRAGVRGGSKMLQRAFASFGPAYAKSIVELANKISAMPQESRDGFVAALDLTSDDMDMPEEDVIPVGSEEEVFGGEGDEGDDDGEFEDDTLEATLATAGVARRVVKARATVQPGQLSVTAAAILNGDRQLFGG